MTATDVEIDVAAFKIAVVSPNTCIQAKYVLACVYICKRNAHGKAMSNAFVLTEQLLKLMTLD